MIVSEIIEIERVHDNLEIENILRERGIDPVRWAVTGVCGDKFEVSVSYLAYSLS
ncbi:MAG: hypothetical protein LBK53_02180 [Heliobacteriaceae bacterium]|jgi:hypothetical protein|nr:hypothetical protein [Heliobacteriaceae bacterium]